MRERRHASTKRRSVACSSSSATSSRRSFSRQCAISWRPIGRPSCGEPAGCGQRGHAGEVARCRPGARSRSPPAPGRREAAPSGPRSAAAGAGRHRPCEDVDAARTHAPSERRSCARTSSCAPARPRSRSARYLASARPTGDTPLLDLLPDLRLRRTARPRRRAAARWRCARARVPSSSTSVTGISPLSRSRSTAASQCSCTSGRCSPRRPARSPSRRFVRAPFARAGGRRAPRPAGARRRRRGTSARARRATGMAVRVPVRRHHAPCELQARDPAVGGGVADRAAAVRADRAGHQPRARQRRPSHPTTRPRSATCPRESRTGRTRTGGRWSPHRTRACS